MGFEYDALGRRTAKIFNENITRWVWDGNTPLHEWSYLLEDRPKDVPDAIGRLYKDREEPVNNPITWVFEEGTFRPAAKLTEKGAYSIITDYLGTPVEMYNKYGEKTWETRLDIYGKVASFEGGKYERSSLSDCPFRYQGQYEDSETGLYYNRFRYYSPDEGMYISQDPIGLEGGNPTLYGYVHDVNGLVDVFGLSIWKGFSKGELAKHFQKHVIEKGEFGNITQSQYLAKAKAFGEAIGDNIKVAIEGNFMIKHDSTTGEVFVGHIKKKEIRTYYIDDGRSIDAFAEAKSLAKKISCS